MLKKFWTRAANVGTASFCLGIILLVSAWIVAISGVNGPVLGVIPASMLLTSVVILPFGVILSDWATYKKNLKIIKKEQGQELTTLK